jgi:NitT/TauT family transport system substrate-binding protein
VTSRGPRWPRPPSATRRTWPCGPGCATRGYETDQSGGDDVAITPQENPDTLTAFQDGSIDGAWLPEPWATRLIQEAGGHVLVDEADLWPDGQFVTTHLIVAKSDLDDHPRTSGH